MDFRSERGFTGVDIATSVVVIFIFVSLIATLSYNYSSASKEFELKSEATYIAIDEIEKMKAVDFSTIENMGKNDENKGEYEPLKELTSNKGFYRKITIEDYTDNPDNSDKIFGLVKKATVQITYMFKGKEQKVELSTVLAKES